MRAAPTVLLFVAHAASALQPVSVQRRALLGGAAAALVATSKEHANAAGLEQFKTLVDELGALNKAAQAGTASTKALQKGYVATVVPLENAARKNPYNAEYEYGELIAQKISADAAKLKAAGTPEDAAPLLQKLVESTDAYCQTLNCGNLLIYR
mmetsp:Transcript_140/g.510  ORF Transcript_140/g.510 Transcript_140/m.510 type:complete len:154 (-) Transcript_140:12-473(-)